ncbi:MAG: PEP-CTERM sorting domain-containing protein [Fimbriimonadaceae bacterium]
MNKTIAALALLVVTTSAFAQVTVYSNNVGGDAFTDSGTVNPGASQLIGSYTGPNTEVWAYNEVKHNAVVGIDTVNPRSGNGSAHIQTLGGANTNGKASISFGRLNGGSLGGFDTLTNWSADVFTQSSDFAGQAMVLRLFVSNGTDSGFLVFDTTWQPGNNPNLAFGQWNNVDFTSNPNSFWVRGTGSLASAGNLNTGSEVTFASAQSLLAGKGFQVFGANAGFGTSSGAFDGFVDNYTIGFNGQSTTYNFEAVPEPMTMGILAAGAALVARRRKKK